MFVQRGRVQEWSGIRGTFSTELNGSLDMNTNKFIEPLKMLHGWHELVIEFEAAGYRDEGSVYGGKDNLGSPPEGCEERTLVEAYLVEGTKPNERRIDLPQNIQESLFDFYADEIEAVELDYGEEE